MKTHTRVRGGTHGAACLLADLFEEQVERSPDAVAWENSITGIRLSYRALQQRVQDCAAQLRRVGIATGHLVGILMAPCDEFMVSLLAILHSGAAFVVFNRDEPQEYLAYLLQDALPALIVIADRDRDSFVSHQAVVEVTLGDGIVGLRPVSSCPLPRMEVGDPEEDASPAAYVAYTSGTSGPAKGVVVSHYASSHHICSTIAAYGLAEGQRVPLFANPGFDVAVEEILGSVFSGATLVLLPRALVTPATLHTYVESTALTLLNLPASFWHQWVQVLVQQGLSLPASLRTVIVGSEPIHVTRYAQWLDIRGSERVSFLAAYGLTEAVVTSLLYTPQGTAPTSLVMPLGHPLPHVRAFALNAEMREVPLGEEGVLYLAGPALAKGYLRRPQQTATRFLWRGGVRVYHTGDRVRWGSDGWSYLGRDDQQVKISGFRLELAEIEATLCRDLRVQQASVLVADDQVVCFVVLHPSPVSSAEMDQLAEALRAQVLLPSRFIAVMVHFVPSLPASSHGKIDAKALSLEIEMAQSQTRTSHVPGSGSLRGGERTRP